MKFNVFYKYRNFKKKGYSIFAVTLFLLVRPARFERAAYGFEVAYRD
jgi:hypothetical protein